MGLFRQPFRLLVNRMAPLLAAFANLAVLAKNAIHGADRTVIDALVEQGGIDLGRRLSALTACRCISPLRGLIGETWCMQQIEPRLLLLRGQRPGD